MNDPDTTPAPMTADGVPVRVGMTVYALTLDGGVLKRTVRGIGGGHYLQFDAEHGVVGAGASVCYASKAAATNTAQPRHNERKHAPPSAWIRTSERMPAVGERVLVAMKNQGWEYAPIDVAECTGSGWDNDSWMEEIDLAEVTHWQPLPPLPAE